MFCLEWSKTPILSTFLFCLSHEKWPCGNSRLLANTFKLLNFHIFYGYLNLILYETRIHLSINRCSAPLYNPKFFPNPKIQATRNLTLKSQIPFRISAEKGSAVPDKSISPTSPLSKSTPNCLLRASFRNSLSSYRT